MNQPDLLRSLGSNIVHHADSDRAKAVREIQKSDEANSLGTQKGIGTPRVGIQAAAQD
jgi:hypothetical protein